MVNSSEELILQRQISSYTVLSPRYTTSTVEYPSHRVGTHRKRTSVAPTNSLVQEESLAEPSTQTEMAYALRQCQMNVEFKIFHQQRAR